MEGFPPSLTWWGPGGSAATRMSGERVARVKSLAGSLPRAHSQTTQHSEVRAGRSNLLGVLWELRRFLVAICLLAFGSYQLYLALAFRHQQQITYAEFVKTLPSAGWYHVTGVPLDYGFALPHHDQKGVYGRYIPAIVPGAGGISLLVFADDRTEPTKGKVTTTKPIDGIVETVFESSSSVDADLKPYGPALMKNYRIIDEGEAPHVLLGLVFGIAGILIGLLLTLAGIGYIFERHENVQSDPVSSTM